jgi:hypothetical protein
VDSLTTRGSADMEATKMSSLLHLSDFSKRERYPRCQLEGSTLWLSVRTASFIPGAMVSTASAGMVNLLKPSSQS